MKFYLTLIVLIFTLQLAGQVKITPKYIEADPIWMNRIINKNYMEDSTSSLDSFNSHGLLKVIEVDSHIYSLSFTIDPTFGKPPNGYIIYKIDKTTGKVIWKDANTPINGSPGSVLAPDIRIRDDKNIEIIGDRKVFFNDSTFIRYYPFSFRKVYDRYTGAVLGEYYDKENKATIGAKNTFKYARYKCIVEDSLYLVYYYKVHYENNKPVRGMRFALINGEMNQTQDSIANLVYEPGIPTGPFSFGGDYKEVLNDSTIVWLFIHYSTDLTLYPHKVGLSFIDIKDLNNIYVRKKINIEDRIRTNLSPKAVTNFKVINNEIYIINGNLDNDILTRFDVLHLDSEGREISFDSDLKRDSIQYSHADILKVTDSLKYFIGRKQGFRNKNDVFTIDNQGNYKFIASITTKGDIGENYFLIYENTCLLTDNDILIYGGAYAEPEFGKASIMLQGFELKSLIEGTKVDVVDLCLDECNHIDILPNPTQDYATLIFGEPFSGKIFLTDLQGKMILTKRVMNVQNEQIDLSTLQSGMYLLSFFNSEVPYLIRPIKVIKQ